MELIKLLGVLIVIVGFALKTGFNPHHFPGADYDRDRWRPWRRRSS